MTSPVIYLARSNWDYEGTDNFGLALNVEDAKIIAEGNLGDHSESILDGLEDWTGPDPETGIYELEVWPSF